MRFLLALLILASALPARAEGPTAPAAPSLSAGERTALESIRASELMPTIQFLASRELEGREGGERGADVAAQYLVSRFQAAGLQAGTKDGFLQGFDLRYRVLGKDAALTLERGTGDSVQSRALEVRRDFVPLSFSEEGIASGPIVFAGYGIVAPEHRWDDYAQLGRDGARGKIVLLLRHEPDELGEKRASIFDGGEMTLHAALRQKIRVAQEHGALGVLLVDDPVNHEVKENPSAASWRTLTDEERAKPADDPARFRGRPDTRDAASPLGLVAMHASQEILRWLDADLDWKKMQEDYDATGRLPRLSFGGARARLVHDVEASMKGTSNVVALLRGSDPELSKEYVLVGGHYDHEGKDEESGEIYFGADDNASGTAATLAIAEAFSRLPERPKRSVLFAAWAAEEKGLLGSNWFVHHPPVDLEGIVAAINLDMVGRNKELEMSVVGRGETPDLVELFDRFSGEVGFTLNDDAGAGASRSDNASLWLAGIPCASLFSGTHEDYHEPTDTAGKVVPGKVEKAARLAFLVANEVASGRATPKPLDVPPGPWKPVAPASRIRRAPAATPAPSPASPVVAHAPAPAADAPAASAAATDTPSATSLIQRAIEIHGGRSALARLPDLEMRGTSEAMSGRSVGRRSDLLLRERGDGAYRRETTFESRGRKMKPVEFYDGAVCKRRFGQTWDELPTDEPREQAAHRLPFLLAAAGTSARVDGSGSVADAPCWIVSVPDGSGRALLSIAQADARLVAIDFPATSAEGMGTKKDVRRKLVMRDHRRVGDLLLPFDVESSEDGTPEARTRWDSISVLPSFDPGWLRVPDATRRFIPSEELAF